MNRTHPYGNILRGAGRDGWQEAGDQGRGDL